MQLGSAIGPPQSAQMSKVLEDAVAQVLREKGDSAALIKQAMDSMGAVVVKLTAIADQQQAASASLASASESLTSAARSLAMRTTMPAPEVTVNVAPAEVEIPSVNVPAPVVNIPAPVVNVDVPAATVTVMDAPTVERGVRKTVHRDSKGLITHITEEPM